jgi:hypothetical protein
VFEHRTHAWTAAFERDQCTGIEGQPSHAGEGRRLAFALRRTGLEFPACSISIALAMAAVSLGPPRRWTNRRRASSWRIQLAASLKAADRLPPYDSRARRLSTATSSAGSDTLTLIVLPARFDAIVLPE